MSMAAASSKTFQVTLAMLGLLATAPAVELKPKTVEAFDRYVRLSETRIQQELSKQGTFLWMDSVPQPQRDQVQARLRAGEIVIERLETFDGGQEIEVPDGLIHHWLGVVFIPGTTLKSTLALVQDYDTHAKVYKPDVLAAKLVSRNGNDFKIFLRLFKKKVITVVMNTEHEVRYFPVGAARIHSRSYTTRIAEVENPGKPDEHEKPVGNDGGFLWRLYSYWRFEEKAGGVFVQCEAISLTRGIPKLLAWL
ncbi:MAG: hypothetical protein ACRD24_15220, partial [Terriglobales bacterium]